MHLVILIELFAVQGGMTVAPTRYIKKRLRPIGISTARITVFKNIGCHPSILAGTEFVKTIYFNYQISLRDFQASNKSAGVIDFINVELHPTLHRISPLCFVVHVIPARRIIQPADLVDCAGADNKTPGIEIVLFRCIDSHLRAGL